MKLIENKWTLCMIVKDEEEVIERCLKSVKDIFDEIIIVDTGSKDHTKEILKKYTSNIYDFKWIDDFSKARNYAFKKATGDYIMWLDADDIIKAEDLKKMRQLKQNINPDINIYLFKYHISFDQQGIPIFSYYRERLIKNNNKNKWQDQVHEYIPLTGKIEYTDIAICHKKEKQTTSKRNLNIYIKMQEQKKHFTPRNRYYFARELYDHQEYEKAIKEFKKFLSKNRGWVEDNINACLVLSDCYQKIGETDKSLETLYKSFVYDIPRKKTCCYIGNWYMEKKQYKDALLWYQFCLLTDIRKEGFYEKDYDEFIPYLNMCVCYDYLGNKRMAKQYHDLTKKIKPQHPIVLHNEQYFNNQKEA